MTAMRPAPTASRSATGSRILPSSETWFVRRATYPSTQSVAATPANSSIPAISVPSCTISVTNTGISRMRRNDRRFGMVRMADDAGSRPPVLFIGRAGRIRTGDLLSPRQTR